jgi:hypothetical protein
MSDKRAKYILVFDAHWFFVHSILALGSAVVLGTVNWLPLQLAAAVSLMANVLAMLRN